MSDTPTDEVKLNDLMFQALDHAVASIADSGGPLIPFSIIDTEEEEKKLTRFMAENLEEGVSQMHSNIEGAKEGIVRYALAWDGFVTIEGKKWDALLVEAGDKVSEHAVLLCQKYKKKGFLRKGIVPIGNPGLLEKPPSRIQ